MLAAGTLVNGRYQVTELIGHGGMSNVFKAYDRVTNATLAIKESRRTGKQDNRTTELSLATEAHLLKNLYNPHLPRIYDIIEDEDHIMIVMDFVEGVSLDKYLAQNGAVPPALVIDWGIQICEVFYYLHTQNPPIIYRDMKPANLILQPNGNIMMIDFGTARTWKNAADRTSDTMLIGTEGFAAPEQFGGRGQSDARTDIFCLGATLFNLVTNHSPYLKPFGITPLGNWDPALKDCALDKIIQKCTMRDPYERFQTASELREALIAAKNNTGRTGLFAKIGKKNNDKVNEWQTPVMQAGPAQDRTIAQQQAQMKAQQEAQMRAQQQAQMRAQQEAQMRAQQQAQMRAQQEAQMRAQQQAQMRAQQEAQMRAQQEAQLRAQLQAKYEAEIRAQMQAGGQRIQPPVSDNMKDIWKILMIVAAAAGLLMLIFAILVILSSVAGGIVMIVLALALIGFGVYCLLKYRSGSQS